MEYGVSEIAVNPSPISQPQDVSVRDAESWRSVFGQGGRTDSGVVVNGRTALGYPPLWRGINLISNSVSGMPVDVYRRKGEDRVPAKKHPAFKLIHRKASPVQTAVKFRKTLTSHALLYGNGFAAIERNAMQEPVALWPVDPRRVMIVFEDDDQLGGELWYIISLANGRILLPSRDMLHVCGLSHDGISGLSVVDLMADALGVGMAAQRFGAKFFGEGSNSSGVLMVPGHFDEEKIRNTMSAWKEMNAGLKNSHKVALLQDGAKFEKFSVPPDSAQFLQTRNYEVRATVANILGVPPHLLGDDTRTSHNSLEQENKSYLNHSLDPWLIEWEQELQQKLLSARQLESNSHFVEFNRAASVNMEFKEKIDGLFRQIEMGMLTVNEARKIQNLPPIDDGTGDIRYRPANWMEAGTDPEPVNPVADPEPPTGDEPTEGDVMNMLRTTLVTSVTSAIQIEKRRILAAIPKEPDISAWMNDFYEKWTTLTCPDFCSPAAELAKSQHASESIRQIVEVVSSSSTSNVEQAAKEVMATWEDRGQILVEKLIKTI